MPTSINLLGEKLYDANSHMGCSSLQILNLVAMNFTVSSLLVLKEESLPRGSSAIGPF